MAMCVSKDNGVALTVSADHLIGRYDLTVCCFISSDYTTGLLNIYPQAVGIANNVSEVATTHRTKHPGNGSIVIRDDGKVCAVGSWDGK